ncbi:MAG: KH domain-containing protein [Clostridia bacterium]|nr:KH domain-containing protein [Clostridia bacterium]
MVELVRYIVGRLVDHPESVEIKTESDGDNETITIYVEKDDAGKIIGKQGRIATAIRTVVRAAGSKSGKKYSVEIVDKPEVDASVQE